MSVRILTGMCILFRYLVDIPLCLSLVLASKTIAGNMRSISCMHAAWGQLDVPNCCIRGFNSIRHPGPFLTLEW